MATLEDMVCYVVEKLAFIAAFIYTIGHFAVTGDLYPSKLYAMLEKWDIGDDESADETAA